MRLIGIFIFGVASVLMTQASFAKDYQFKFNSESKQKTLINYETYKFKPGENEIRSFNLPDGQVEFVKTLNINDEDEWVRFSGNSNGFEINPIIIKIKSLRKLKRGFNEVDIILIEKLEGSKVDLATLINTIANDRFYKLLTINENKRLDIDEYVSLGTFLIIDEKLKAPLELIQLDNTKDEKLVHEFEKADVFFAEKSEFAGAGITGSVPQFAARIKFSKSDSGFVEFKFNIEKLQVFAWNSQSPYNFLVSEKGNSIVKQVNELLITEKISRNYSLYFVSSYVILTNLIVERKTYDKKGRDLHGRVALSSGENGAAIEANKTYTYSTGYNKADKINKSVIKFFGKDYTPLINANIEIKNLDSEIKNIAVRELDSFNTLKSLYDKMASNYPTLGLPDHENSFDRIKQKINVLDDDMNVVQQDSINSQERLIINTGFKNELLEAKNLVSKISSIKIQAEVLIRRREGSYDVQDLIKTELEDLKFDLSNELENHKSLLSKKK